MTILEMAQTLEKYWKTPQTTRPLSPSILAKSWQTPSFVMFQSPCWDLAEIIKTLPLVLVFIMCLNFNVLTRACSAQYQLNPLRFPVSFSFLIWNTTFHMMLWKPQYFSTPVIRFLSVWRVALVTFNFLPTKHHGTQVLSWQMLYGTKRELPPFYKGEASKQLINFSLFLNSLWPTESSALEQAPGS